MRRIDCLLAIIFFVIWLAILWRVYNPPAPPDNRGAADLIWRQDWYRNPSNPANPASPLSPLNPVSPLYPRS